MLVNELLKLFLLLLLLSAQGDELAIAASTATDTPTTPERDVFPSQGSVLSINVLHSRSGRINGVYTCKIEFSGRRRTARVGRCYCASRELHLVPRATYEGGKKVVRWQVKNGAGAILETTAPLNAGSLLVENDPAGFAHDSFIWKGVEELCRHVLDLSTTTASKNVPLMLKKLQNTTFSTMQVMADVVASDVDKTYPHDCAAAAALRGDSVERIASLRFGEWKFEEVGRRLLREGANGNLARKGVKGAIILIDALLCNNVQRWPAQSSDVREDELNAGVDLLLSFRSTKTEATSKQRMALLELTKQVTLHYLRGDLSAADLHMSLAQELMLVGSVPLAAEHTMAVAEVADAYSAGGGGGYDHSSDKIHDAALVEDRFYDFCKDVPRRGNSESRRYFFMLRQCLQNLVPTTLKNEHEGREKRRKLIEMVDGWNDQLENDKRSGRGVITTLEPHVDIGVRHVFLVVYQGQDDDLEVYRKLATLHRNLSPMVLEWHKTSRERSDGAKLRIGLISNSLGFHSVGRLLKGVFGKLDVEKFELFIIMDGGLDDISSELAQRADKIVRLPSKISDCQELLSSLTLDVLIFGDVGMDAKVSYIAYGRYCPVQVAFWGHPVR